MQSEIPIHLLKSHPKNAEYFSALTPEKHEEIRRSIETQGIRDPLKIVNAPHSSEFIQELGAN